MEHLTAVAALITAIASIVAAFQYKKRRDKLAAVRDDFEKVIRALASDNELDRLAAAILLRRFFDPATEAGEGNAPFATETVDVIAAILRVQPSGEFQKLLADGLRYAPSLRGVDLQRTNLRNAYLGSRKRQLAPAILSFRAGSLAALAGRISPRAGREPVQADGDAAGDDELPLDLSHADFYRADLSNASLKGARADGAVFYQCRMKNTVLKRASLRNANFFEADLQGATFDGARLAGANFQDARNIPPSLAARLDQAARYRGDEPFTAPNSGAMPPRPTVFVSRPGCLDRARALVIDGIGAWLEAEGIDTRALARTDYPAAGALGEVQRLMQGCAGVVVFGFGDLEVREGRWRQGTPDSRVVTGRLFGTAWSQLESGMAAMHNLPLLVVADPALTDGIFDKAVSEHHIYRLAPDAERDSPAFADWCAAVRDHVRAGQARTAVGCPE